MNFRRGPPSRGTPPAPRARASVRAAVVAGLAARTLLAPVQLARGLPRTRFKAVPARGHAAAAPATGAVRTAAAARPGRRPPAAGPGAAARPPDGPEAAGRTSAPPPSPIPPRTPAPAHQHAPLAEPPIVPRQQWGADESLRKPTPPKFAQIT